MLITPSLRHLKRVAGPEALQRMFEETEHMVARFRLDDHEELKNAEKRMGKPMSHNELIRRVVKLNPQIFAEDSLADSNVVGFYTTDHEGKKKYLVAFDKGYLPEFSYILVDAADLPVKEKRGWRTVLHRLLKLKALRWSDVVAIFGDAYGQNAARWRMNTQEHRV